MKFHTGDFWLDDVPLSSRSVVDDSNQIQILIENNQHYTTEETPDVLKLFKSGIENNLHQLSYGNHFDVWVSHKLSKKTLDRISIHDSLLKRKENVPFFKLIVTGDEKWILYNNVEWKRSWGKRKEPPSTMPNANLYLKKVMLCIWWNWKKVLYYEILFKNQMISSKNYCSQLD